MNASEIRPEMPVFAKGSEKKDPESKIRVATVDHLDGSTIKLNRKDSNDGSHHWIPLDWVDKVENGTLVLNRTEGEFMNERKDSNQAMKSNNSGSNSSREGNNSSRDTTSGNTAGSASQSTAVAEGPVAKAIETQTVKLSSDVFLWSAGGAALASAGLALFGRKNASTFIGQWVPTILLFGLYNKLVKVAGSDRTEESAQMGEESSEQPEEEYSSSRRMDSGSSQRDSSRPKPRISMN